MEPVNYDKPRIVSTVILGIFLVACLFLSITLIPVTWAAVKAATESAADSADSPEGAVVGGSVAAFALALGMVLVIIVYIGTFITSAICLPFAVKNRKSTLFPIRIISYIYDGLFAAVLILSVVKLILAFAGV